MPDGWNIQSLTLTSPQLQLAAAGHWSKLASGGQETEIDLSIESPKLGRLLEDFRFARNIDDAPAVFNSRLQWPYGPQGFSRERLNGRVDMHIGKGTFLNVNPGVGRIFGLLNLGALQRRLTLDFSDVFAKGFAFDSIEGGSSSITVMPSPQTSPSPVPLPLPKLPVVPDWPMRISTSS